MRYDLSGQWKIELPDGRGRDDGFLPGTLDENEIGDPDRIAKAWHPDIEDRSSEDTEFSDAEARITTRLTRNYTYEGPAEFSRIFEGDVDPGKRYLLYIERTRAAKLFVDGIEAPCLEYGLSTPTVFDVTGLIRRGSSIKLVIDNTYPGMPYRDITFSSAATDETQTNWNGAVGEIFLEELNAAYITEVRVLPADGEDRAGVTLSVRVVYGPVDQGTAVSSPEAVVGADSDKGTDSMSVRISGTSLLEAVERPITLSGGNGTEFRIESLPLTEEAANRRWDEYEKGKLTYEEAQWRLFSV